MTDHSARPDAPASSARLAELHHLCDQDYAKGKSQRATVACQLPSYTAFATATAIPPVPATGDLDIAIHVAKRMLATYGDASTFDDVFAYAQAHGGLTEALRILLHALSTELPAGGER